MFCEKCGKYVQGDHCPDCDTAMARHAAEEAAKKRQRLFNENVRIKKIRPLVTIAFLLSLTVSIMALFPVLEWKVWGDTRDTVSLFSINRMTTLFSLAGILLPPLFLGCYNASGDVRNGWMLTVSAIAEAVLPCCSIATQLEYPQEKVEVFGPRYTVTVTCIVWMILACICVILILIAKARIKSQEEFIKDNYSK